VGESLWFAELAFAELQIAIDPVGQLVPKGYGIVVDRIGGLTRRLRQRRRNPKTYRYGDCAPCGDAQNGIHE
jgi:hypothetical protein